MQRAMSAIYNVGFQGGKGNITQHFEAVRCPGDGPCIRIVFAKRCCLDMGQLG